MCWKIDNLGKKLWNFNLLSGKLSFQTSLDRHVKNKMDRAFCFSLTEPQRTNSSLQISLRLIRCLVVEKSGFFDIRGWYPPSVLIRVNINILESDFLRLKGQSVYLYILKYRLIYQFIGKVKFKGFLKLIPLYLDFVW